MKILFCSLFVIGVLFSIASQVPAWFIGADKPTAPAWKAYGLIALFIWILIIILANVIL